MAVKDEFRLHLYYITKLVKKYPRVLVYAPFGEGKKTIFDSLEKKFPGVNFYHSGYFPPDEPFVYAITDPNQQNIPDFDIIYCMQYSTEYKESQTGYRFEPGEWRPFGEYVRKIKQRKIGQRNLSGKTFKALDKLREAV